MTVEDDIASYEGRQERAKERAHEVKMRRHTERMARIKAKRELMSDRRYRGDRMTVIFCSLFAVVAIVIVLSILYGATRPSPPQSPEQLQDQRERYEICMQVEKDQYVCDD